MADVEAKCPQCGKVIVVSEFADLRKIICKDCKSPFKSPDTVPSPVTAPSPPSRLTSPEPTQTIPLETIQRPAGKLRVQRPTERAAASEMSGAPSLLASHPQTERVVARVDRTVDADETVHVRHNLYAWIIFIVLGSACAYGRYGQRMGMAGLPPDILAMLASYGWIIAVAFHLLIIIKAFKDSVFQGTLCTLVPLYSFYYVFAVADDFYMRAVLGALLILVGQDSAEVFRIQFGQWFDFVNDFITKGGGSVR